MSQIILHPLLRTHEEGDGDIAMIYSKHSTEVFLLYNYILQSLTQAITTQHASKTTTLPQYTTKNKQRHGR